MEDKDKLEHLITLSQIHRSLHEKRQKLEFKVLVLTLSLYVLGAFAVLKDDIQQNITFGLKCGTWVVFIFTAFIASTYLRSIHRANRKNIIFAETSENEIARIIENEKLNELIKNFDTGRPNPYWSWWWQMITILIVACASAIIISLA